MAEEAGAGSNIADSSGQQPSPGDQGAGNPSGTQENSGTQDNSGAQENPGVSPDQGLSDPASPGATTPSGSPEDPSTGGNNPPVVTNPDNENTPPANPVAAPEEVPVKPIDNPKLVIGQVLGNGIFPFQGESDGFILEINHLSGDIISAEKVAEEPNDSHLNNKFSTKKAGVTPFPSLMTGAGISKGWLARINWGRATYDHFMVYQNFNMPGVEPCHIAIGSSSQVTAEDVSVDTSEVFAKWFTDGDLSIDNYWTASPEEDLPRRVNRGTLSLNGDLKMKAHNLRASHMTIPNFSFSVNPGQKFVDAN